MSTVDTTTAANSTVRTLEDYQKTRSNSKNSLGQDEFLKILVAQMSNQDPMEPTSNGDFLAQMAQFSLLEQFSQLSAGFSTSQAYSMIGKYVYIEDGSELIYGKVDGVVTEDGVNYLLIGGKTYDSAKVAGVMDASSVESDLDEKILQSSNLIGKTIKATFKDKDGVETTVSGQVSKLVIKDGQVFAVVDDKNVPVASITEIA